MKVLLQKMVELISAGEKKLGFDWRTSWSRVTPGERDTIDILVSREELIPLITGEGGALSTEETGPGRIRLLYPEGQKVDLRV
ncbi:MAG: hypothetical protein JXB45_12345, partial [Candidatus Krumholzibacteriota bacterium]|nr:hypothetical protein [Candidatus Krumholzibacteriota bacterium]